MSSVAFLGPQNAPKLLARPHKEAYNAPQTPLAGNKEAYFKAPTSEGRGGEERVAGAPK